LTPGSEPIPIIGGTGALGAGLARRWAKAGVPVVLGSRSAERAEEAAAKIREAVPGADVSGLENTEAATRGEIVFLTVPFRAQSENLNNLREALRPGQILVDCTVPLAAAVSGKATRSLGVWQGSAAQQAQEMVPEGVTVVAALHTVGAPTLAELDEELGEDILVCGDKKADKARVARLIELIPGLRAVNAGALEMARIVEQLTPLLISVNVRYKAHAGIRLTNLPDADHWA
jgi:NADPH-dependent F420 reductase